jgi:hypothetical protein
MSSKETDVKKKQVKQRVSTKSKPASKEPGLQPHEHPYTLGSVFIRTVTHHYTGILAEVWPTELVLTDCAWIADDGRFSTAIASGQYNEIEPFPNGRVVIGRGAIIDCHASLNSSPPRVQK